MKETTRRGAENVHEKDLTRVIIKSVNVSRINIKTQ